MPSTPTATRLPTDLGYKKNGWDGEDWNARCMCEGGRVEREGWVHGAGGSTGGEASGGDGGPNVPTEGRCMCGKVDG